MRSFVDKTGQRWTLEMTFGAFRRLHAAGFDAADLTQLERMANDPDVAILVLMELCRADLKDSGLSQVDFEDRFDLDVLSDAIDAAAEAIVDFFPERRRETLREILAKSKAAADRAVIRSIETARQRLDSGEIDAHLERTLNGRLGNVPA